MARNIEIKARIASVDAVLPKARTLADGDAVTIEQDDTFYAVPHGRLKLRRFADSSAELIHYHRADTVDANLQLGFDADLRSYDLAAGILGDLGVTSVRLMTNNPQKISGLERAGVVVDAHEPHWVGSTEHSADYLAVKKTKLGHLA